MDFSVFQGEAAETIDQLSTRGDTIAYILASAAEEMGEVAGTVRAYFRTGCVDHEQLTDDLADLQWYLSAIAVLFDLSLEEIAQYSLEKVQRRQHVAAIEYKVASRMWDGHKT
jgi:NTP pyrophosphatase (non-canonical NTP hydrolase)